MNVARLIASVIAVAVVMYLFDFIYHGMILGNSYGETAESWRPEDEMMKRHPYQILCYFIIAIGFCTVWAFGFGERGIRCGAIYGFFLGLTGTGGIMMNFVFLPIPDQFQVPWAIGGVLSSIIAGITTALVYKPKAS